jgi:hypothetical protein
MPQTVRRGNNTVENMTPLWPAGLAGIGPDVADPYFNIQALAARFIPPSQAR